MKKRAKIQTKSLEGLSLKSKMLIFGRFFDEQEETDYSNLKKKQLFRGVELRKIGYYILHVWGTATSSKRTEKFCFLATL